MTKGSLTRILTQTIGSTILAGLTGAGIYYFIIKNIVSPEHLAEQNINLYTITGASALVGLLLGLSGDTSDKKDGIPGYLSRGCEGGDCGTCVHHSSFGNCHGDAYKDAFEDNG